MGHEQEKKRFNRQTCAEAWTTGGRYKNRKDRLKQKKNRKPKCAKGRDIMKGARWRDAKEIGNRGERTRGFQGLLCKESIRFGKKNLERGGRVRGGRGEF